MNVNSCERVRDEVQLDMMNCCCLVFKSRPTHLPPHGLLPVRLSVHGISQARILEWIAISSSRGLMQDMCVQFLVGELRSHMQRSNCAILPQLLNPCALEPVSHN